MTTSVKTIYKEHEKMFDQPIKVNGWVRTIRDSKTFGFIELNDGSYLKNIQVVFEDNLNNFAEICKLGVSSALTVEGILVQSQGNKQPFEIKATTITIHGDSPSNYPLQKKGHSMEFLRSIAHLRPRTNTFSAVFRVRSLLAFAIHKYFNENGFIYVHTPIITANDAEGAGEMFRVSTLDAENPPRDENGNIDWKQDFFGKKSSLTVSGQLEGEAFATAFGKIYTFGPTFRAENSNTTRHLSEFWMIEPEIAFADLSDDMDMGEAVIKYVFQYILDNAPAEIDFFTQFINPEVRGRMEKLVKSSFARVTYTEAIELLKNSGVKFDYPPEWGVDIQTEHERYLAEKIFNGPVFVTDYPKDIKAFYMKLNPDGKTVAATDLLVPGVGELIGGSQREDNLDVLLKRMAEMGVPHEELDWYLDFRRFGSVPHAGFGIGFERLVMYVTGMENIRDVIPFPRSPKTCEY